MEKKIHPNYIEINTLNKMMFERFGIDNDTMGLYRCTCCGNDTYISGSASKQGADLICGGCAYGVYGSWSKAMYYHCGTLTHCPDV